MSVQINWTPDLSVGITSFQVSVSTDKGLTFTVLATVPFNTASGAPNYDQRLKQFFYIDAGGVAGNIYKVLSIGTNGISIPEYTIAPPAAYPMCTVYGYLVDSFGEVDTKQRVDVRAFGSRGERWAKNPAGVISQDPRGLAIISENRIVSPDSTGIWQIALIQGSFARVEIRAIEYVKAFEVPSVPGPIHIKDIPQLQGESLGLFDDLQGADRSRFPNS